MNKKFILIGGLLVLGIVGILAFALNGRGSASSCKDFIATIEDGKAEKSYDMLSPTAQKATSLKEWQGTVASLQDFYGNTEPKLTKTTPATDPLTETPQTKNIYAIKTSTGSYNITCIVNDNGLIEIFDSQVDLGL